MKKETLQKRIEELEAEVRFLNWLMDKHVYKDHYLHRYFVEPTPKPDPFTGWSTTS